jgi:hypothetical protein
VAPAARVAGISEPYNGSGRQFFANRGAYIFGAVGLALTPNLTITEDAF